MILVVGGAGYIGSHVVKKLLDSGKNVVVLDNLTTGHRNSIDARANFLEGDIGSNQKLDELFSKYEIESVMHFAASSLVGESVENPAKYYENNVSNTLTLLTKMMEYNVKKFIFSSTAATYGLTEDEMITEKTTLNPINPYGRSKLMIEQIAQDFHEAYQLNYVVLRYFNAAGADPSGIIGENHDPETHLIPLVLKNLLGERENITIFGEDYDTFDGTCIRDYIHVNDLADAHILSLEALLANHFETKVYNLGNGNGYSVKEIINMCEKVSSKKANILIGDRRDGDPSKLVADATKIKKELNWKPLFNLEKIVQHAWNYHVEKKH
ncbi:UDP-glucose 4-epimerase GalE [Exiguobacterium sp. H66]|uniref:UDP-glucose 4-epimerase GalE n=1 Tax=Exiguobacterium sp. H66 TaxID=2751208 RepID=UPI001BEA29A2|nr:UDP-glucose 4-epimerase GalE [Exiguobacterium sp. H66]